jgi:hypothetical protein
MSKPSFKRKHYWHSDWEKDAMSGQQKKPKTEAIDRILEAEIPPGLLRKVIAAAKASGRTPSEWICEAVAEAIERKSSQGKNGAITKQ